MPNNTKLLDAICELLEVPTGSLHGTEILQGFENWSSLTVLGFLAYVDENYGVTLSPEKIMACKTVSELASLASQHA